MNRRRTDFTGGYSTLLRVPGFGLLYAGLVLGRTGNSMMLVTLVLFALARYHQPALAGATASAAVLPGLLVSPLAGALIDRYGRARLVALDYAMAAAALAVIAGLALLSLLPPWLLIAIVGLGSLTNPLSSSGARTLFPILTPPELWMRANALDSGGYVLASIMGPPLAGGLVGTVGPEWTLAATACVFVGGSAVMAHLAEPPYAGRDRRSLIRNSWLGLKYTLANPSLRGLGLSCSSFSVSSGILVVALPVLVLSRLHQGPATVGFLWAAMGAGGIASALAAGRLASPGDERHLMAGSVLVNALALAVLPLAGSIDLVLIIVVLMGLGSGPFDVGLFTLRQRRTAREWFGRAFAISVSINTLGTPLGSAAAGPLIGVSLNTALWVAAAVAFAAAAITMVAIPRSDPIKALVEAGIA